MEEWLRIGRYQVQELLEHDPEYQKILCDLSVAEKEYNQIMKKLTPEQRELIDTYIALCEELEYQRTHTAYRYGKLRTKGK